MKILFSFLLLSSLSFPFTSHAFQYCDCTNGNGDPKPQCTCCDNISPTDVETCLDEKGWYRIENEDYRQ